MRPLCRVIPLLLPSLAFAQPESVVGSPHDLSVGGPGPIRATFEDQVCIFCHTPHNATPIRPLWNRFLPVDNYRIYASRALDAEPGQPTGASKMCLSCHDGTIALGLVFSRQNPILLSGGVTVMPQGPANLGTDLSDDHPISFRYDSGLAAKDRHLLDPSVLPAELRLDANSELQCTTCHDAHNDSRGNFLVMHNDNSELCLACHQISTTTVTEHESCNACHQPHTAPSGPYLLRGRTIADTCLTCHDGSHQSAKNIAGDLGKPSIHETYSQVDPPDPRYTHTSCTSCHDPHSMQNGTAEAPLVHPDMGSIDGVNASGSPITVASYEYEVCFKCHGDQQASPPLVARVAPDNNTRLQFSPGAISSHPVEAPGNNPDVPSLRPGWTTSSMVHCSDCHNSESGSHGGGSGPNGVHGSAFSPLLAARYDTLDYTTESAGAYALCYQCHDRNSILDDESFPTHQLHVVQERTPCSACHTGHGIASSQGTGTGNTHLINFDTTIVRPNSQGRLEFRDTGLLSGECFLSCHGADHNPAPYPDD